MEKIVTTRFNNKTIEQNRNYRNNANISGCIYGVPIQIKSSIPEDCQLYVIEMNNDLNKIEGLGLIKNKTFWDKNYRIYEDMDYNRYIYRGNVHIPVSKIKSKYYKKVIHVLEQLLFKGERHCKRASGITELQQWIINNKYDFDFVKCFQKLFEKYSK